jgi:hypothetical protein
MHSIDRIVNHRVSIDICQRRSPLLGFWIAAPLLLTLGCSASVPPPVPAGAPVAVSFSVPSDSSPQQLQISGTGRPEQGCELPCTMQVPSGSALVSVSGPRKLLMPVVIPAEPAKGEIRYQRRGQAIAGWLMAIAGATGGSIALAVTRNSGPDGQLKGGIAGATLGGVGLVGLIVALTSGKDEVQFSADPGLVAPPAPKNQ